MSRHRKILILAGVVLIAAILVPVIRHYQLRAATETYIAKLKAKGEPMDLEQVIPPPVPMKQNDAPAFLKAASVINTNWDVLSSNPPPAMCMVAPGRAMIGWAQPRIWSEYGSNSWENVGVSLAKENGALNSLRQIAAGHLALDFRLDYAGGYDALKLLYLPSLKGAAQGLSASAIFNLHRGDAASAVESARAMLLLANAMQHDRLIISELVRMAIAQMASAVNWEILQSPNITDKQLARLQHDWMSLDFIRGDEDALAMERVMGKITGEKWRASDSHLHDYFDIWCNAAETNKEERLFDQVKFGFKVFRWRFWWSYPDELRLLKGYQIALQSVRVAQTNMSIRAAFQKQKKEMSKLGIPKNASPFWFSDPNNNDLRSIMSASILSLNPLLDKVMRAETTKQIMITAIALKRYQLKHGNHPPNLHSLVPEFLSSVPFDPVDGQPLHYRRNADGTFLLYSVGENGKDDGGNPALEKGAASSDYYWLNPQALDWVWPQPATPKEIQQYYDRHSKGSAD